MVRSSLSLAFVLLVVALAGCTREVPVPVPASPPPAAPAAPTTTPTDTSAAATSTNAADGDGGGDGGDERCRLDDLSAGTTRPEGSGQQEVRVVWTNTSGAPCSMTGFGGADLVASPRSEDRYSLPRAQRETSTVRLAPGEQAHSTITFLPAERESAEIYAATKVYATPPDETHSVLLDWPGGPVLRQDGATRPGTYLGPVEAGAS